MLKTMEKIGILCNRLLVLSILVLLMDQPRAVSGGSILFYMPFVSKSIKITFMPVAEEMASRGHEVAVVMQHPTKNPNPNIKEIIIGGNEFIDMTERVSNEKLKSGADATPPLMDMINTAVVVSISIISSP